jgi:hypothetical protein
MQIQSIKFDLDVYLDECVFICEKGSYADFNILEWCTSYGRRVGEILCFPPFDGSPSQRGEHEDFK